ncbi:MAG: MmgE/PrpD family protein [Rhodobacteraceae bacterium]|nr:MmgE/PrpD family protein [Paracoccaceae bacterium]
MSEIADILANFTQSGLADNADPAREVMRLSLIDWCAVGIAGQNEPVASIMREIAEEEGGQGQARIFGAPGLYPARAAAMVNGTISHALDYDDTHFGHIGHPSVAVIPAALAVTQTCARSGSEFLDAALIGAEASVRFGLWLGRGHYQSGFHQTATAGAFGACVAAARLYDLGHDQAKQALGIVASRAAGLKAQFGSMAKPYHAGMAAESGVIAAALAKRGFVANPDAIDGAAGFGETHAGEGALEAFSGMGQYWVMEDVSHKFHACCHGTHAMIEALLALAPQVTDGQIKQIEVKTHKRWMNVCNIATPATGLEAKFSYAHLAAMVLRGLDTAALTSYTDRLALDVNLTELAARVRVSVGEDISETACEVTLTLKSGEALTATHDLNSPMDISARRKKVLHKAAALLGDQAAGDLWQAITSTSGPDLACLLPKISSVKG